MLLKPKMKITTFYAILQYAVITYKLIDILKTKVLEARFTKNMIIVFYLVIVVINIHETSKVKMRMKD